MNDQLKFDFSKAVALELERATKILWDNMVNDMETLHLMTYAPGVGYTNDLGEPVFVEEADLFYENSYFFGEDLSAQFMPPSGCAHQWKEYVGFTARYNYCEKCGDKA